MPKNIVTVEEKPVYNWTTEFNTFDGTMTHRFLRGMEIVVNFKHEKIFTMRNGRIVGKMDFKEDPITLGDYERLLIQVAKIDEEL